MENHPYIKEIKIADEFLSNNKNHLAILELNQKLSNTGGMSHSDIWSIVYDVIYDNFKRTDVPREVVTGLSYLYEF